MMALLMMGSIINYLTRSSLSVAAPTLLQDLHISAKEYSWIVAAFQGAIMASAFEADVTEALIPFVDSTFRTTADRDHRAMAGLSMGGMQTFHVTLRHLDLFSYIGGFSGAGAAQMLAGEKLDARTAYNGAFADPEAFAKKVRLLWLGVGTEEPERMRDGIRGLHASLTEAKIPHVYWESPGTDHEWQTWRRDLKDFAPRLFKPAAH